MSGVSLSTPLTVYVELFDDDDQLQDHPNPKFLDYFVDFFYGSAFPEEMEFSDCRLMRMLAAELGISTLRDACSEWMISNVNLDSAWSLLGDAIEEELAQRQESENLKPQQHPQQQPQQPRDPLLEMKGVCLDLMQTIPNLLKIEDPRKLATISNEAVLEVVKQEALPVPEEQLFTFVKKVFEAKKKFASKGADIHATKNGIHATRDQGIHATKNGVGVSQILRHFRFSDMSSSFFYSEVVSSGLLSAKETANLCRTFAASTSISLGAGNGANLGAGNGANIGAGNIANLGAGNGVNPGVNVNLNGAGFQLFKRKIPPFVLVMEEEATSDSDNSSSLPIQPPMTVGFFSNEQIGDLKMRIGKVRRDARATGNDFRLVKFAGVDL